MNKIKDLVNKNYKVVIGIIIGITISIGIGVSALATKDITYDNSKSGLTSTNLQGAIDELYEKANNSGVPIDPDTFKTNSAKTIYASSKGICIFRNNKLNCFTKKSKKDGTKKMKTITAYFKNHEPVTFTISVFELLKTDEDVTTIIDSETGEILFTR